MAVELYVDDDGQLARLSSGLRSIDRSLKRELSKGLKAAVEPTKSKIGASARSKLPTRGGLAGLVASARVSTRSRLSAHPNVRLEVDSPGLALRALDEGRLRHPTFGRGPWVSQSVPSGFFSDPIEADAPRMRRDIERTVQRVVDGSLRKL